LRARRAARSIGRALPLALALLLGGCRGCASTRPPIHLNPNMDDQPRVDAQAESKFFYDGAAMRMPVEGTVAQGDLQEDSAWFTGKDAAGGWVATVPGHDDAAALARGEQRFGIFCSPCHGPAADGKGMLFQRAQVQSANLMEARFRAMPTGQLFDEVSHGVGLMPAYGPFIPVADRWAILAYLRKLQAETPVPAAAAEPAAEQAGAAPASGAETAGAPGQPATPAAQTGAPGPSGSPSGGAR
jgi:mono/diheme cytochrome c family protein